MSRPPIQKPGCISIRGLTRRFGSRVALQPLDLDLGPGGITGLLGPNGSGKTTLLRMLLGLLRPSGGQAALDGMLLRGDGTAIRRRVAYMPGELAVYGELRGGAHLKWMLRGRSRASHDRGVGIAEGLGLPLDRRVRAYSAGMKRQLFFAAAMAPDVKLRVLDEPTDGLDPHTRRRVLNLLQRDASRGVTLLLSSHHLGEVQEVCERMLFLNQGQVLSNERTESLRERSRRVLNLEWESREAAEAADLRLRALGAVEVRMHDVRTTVVLGHDDPLQFLAQIRSDPRSPRPKTIDYGRLVLADLYRDLYGVEGL